MALELQQNTVRLRLAGVQALEAQQQIGQLQARICLLYTSDAADERSSVDLGGRRIIKKKTQSVNRWRLER